MPVETVAASASQVNWWFEWAKLLVPGTVTGLVAVSAATLAYRFANRGRREDIFYKEKYKLYESLDEKLEKLDELSMQFHLQIELVLHDCTFVPPGWMKEQHPYLEVSDDVKYRRIHEIVKLGDELDNQMVQWLNNKRIEMMFGSYIDKLVSQTRRDIRRLVETAQEIAWCFSGFCGDEEEKQAQEERASFWKQHRTVNVASSSINELRKQLFLALDLPTKK